MKYVMREFNIEHEDILRDNFNWAFVTQHELLVKNYTKKQKAQKEASLRLLPSGKWHQVPMARFLWLGLLDRARKGKRIHDDYTDPRSMKLAFI